MTRTTYHENPHDNDADDDKDELSGIVSQPVVCGSVFFVYPSSPSAKANIKKARPTSLSVPRKVIGSALVNLHHDETRTNDKWLTLGAIRKLIYTRFDFDAGIDFTICELKKAANEVGPLWSKILQGNHTIGRLRMMELRWKDFDNVAKKNIEREPGNAAF
jgi:hypothetical protein